MSKKKPTPKDRHRTNHMVRLAPDVFEALKRSAQKGNRALTREVRAALIAWLIAQGEWPGQS